MVEDAQNDFYVSSPNDNDKIVLNLLRRKCLRKIIV